MYLDREMPKDLFNKKYENWDDKIKELGSKQKYIEYIENYDKAI